MLFSMLKLCSILCLFSNTTCFLCRNCNRGSKLVVHYIIILCEECPAGTKDYFVFSVFINQDSCGTCTYIHVRSSSLTEE